MDDEVFGIVTQRLKSEQQAARDEVAIGASDLEKAAKRMRAEAEAARLRQTAIQTQGSTPETAARAQKLGRDMGLPAGVVERNMAEVERQAELRRLDEVATQNPEMAGFLAVPENYSVSRDVLDELTKVADVARSLPAGALKGVGGAVAGTGALIDAGARTIDRGVRGMLGDRVADAFWFEGPDELNPAALLRGAGKAVKSLGADVGVPEDRQNTATDIAEGVGQLSTQIAALILSRGSLGIPMLWGQGADQQAEKQEKVGAYGTAGGDAAIFAGGAVTAITEKFGLDYLMRKLPETVRSGILQKMKDVFLASGAEALQEVTEGILQNVVEYLFYNPDAEILEDFSREAIAAGGAAGIVRSVILAATGGKGAARARKAQEDAQRDAEALKAINQLAETSTLRERSPEKFGEFVRGLLNPEQAVEIDAQTAVELFQSQPNLAEVLPPDVAETLQRDLAIAQQTGADVRMRLSDFVVAFSGTEQFDTLADNVRLSTDAMTLTEAAELSEEEAQQQLNMIRDEMASAIGGVNAAQTIFDDVFAQLKRAAVDDIAATQYAALVAARVRTRAERLGVDAVALYQTNRPLIVRDLGQKTGKAFDALELTLDDLRSPSRISERTAFGQTLVEFLAARGGLLDQGGELQAMDAHLWHKAQRGRRKLVVEQATGSKLTLDEAARAAWEAGYFPEMTDRPAPDDLLAAIERELKGEAVYAPRNRNEQLAQRLDAMGQLDEALNVLGIDAKAATAEQVREAMDRYAAEQEGRPLGAVGRVLEQRAGKPVAESVAEAANVESAFEFAGSEQFATNRDFKLGIQKVVRAAARAVGIDLSRFTRSIETYLVGMAVRDATTALQSNANAVGWYNEKVNKALRVMALIHPELATDAKARFAMTWAMAVTSNGLKVDKNFDLAEEAYRQYRQTGLMRADIGIGTAKSSINDGMDLFNRLVKKHGINRVIEFMTTQHTVRDVKQFTGESVSGEYADTMVYGAAVLGPKIGNGFFANLYGHFEQLTMDRWFMRTWGRWTGSLVNIDRENLELKRKQLAALIEATPPEVQAAFSELIGQRITIKDIDRVATAIKEASASKDTRERMAALGVFASPDQAATMDAIVGKPRKNSKRISFGDELRKLGNAAWKYADGQKEQPDGPEERGKIRQVMQQALAELQKTHPALTMADLQALLWYPEKRLYDAAKTTDAAAEGYDDDEAPDYANAAADLAQRRGVSKGAIDKVFKEVDNEIAAEAAKRAGGAGRGAGVDGSGAQAAAEGDAPAGAAAVQGGAAGQALEQADGGGPRGSIRFLPDGRQLITLTAKADLSTFLHEMSHGWLEELRADAQAPNAPAQVKADWKRTAAYLGIDPNVRVIPTEAHETWARTGEAYFREGRAPAAELSSVFSRFKGWLVRIYRTLSDLRVPINDEIRGVFDRLVATDEEIEAVRQQYQFGGLFAEAAAAGMTEAEFKAYQDIAARAGMIAEQQVLDRLQRDAERTQRAEYLEAREAIGNEIEAQVRAEPVYRAISTLASDEALQLDQKALRNLYGARVVKRLPRGTTKKGGVSPDMVAPMFGFTSGDEMVKGLLSAAPIQQEIADRITARMREQFPDAKSDGRAHEAAVEAMHGDAQLEVLELEFEALKRLGAGRIVEAAVRRKAAGQKAQKQKDVEADAQAQQEDEAIRVRTGVDAGVRAAAAAGRTRVAAQGAVAKQQRMDQAQARRVAVDALTVDREAIEKAADATVGTTKVSEILDTQRWRRAEKMAANAVVQAVAARDWGKAAWHQRQRIIAAHMVRRSVAARAEIERAIERFKRYQSRKPGAIDPDYLAQVRTILEAYQFGPKMSDRTRTILALRQIARWQAALQQDQSAMLEIAPEVLEADAKTHYRDMTLEEFQALRDTVESIATVGRTKTRLLRNQAERDLNRTAALVGETISRNAKERGDRGNVEKGVGYKARQLKDSFFATHRKIESLIREFDGFAALGPVWQALFKPLQDAQNDETRMSIAATKAIKALFEKFPEDARKTWRTRTTYYPEIGQSLSKATVLSLALNWGNEGNREAIRKGFRWSDAQVQAVLDKALTAEDAAFIQSVWDYIDSFWPQLAALEKRVKGIAPVKVDPDPLTIAGVSLRGGYYPLKYDPDRSEKAYSFQVDKMAQQLMSGAVAKASTRSGSAIERVGSGGMPVRLELDVLFEHVAEVIHDISHREAILDVVRLLDHPEVKGAILDTKGPQFHRAMKDWVRDIAAGDVPALSWFDKVIQHLRGGMSISAMGWKLTTALVQPTGFFQSAAALPKGALLKSVSAFYAAPWGMAAKTRFVFDRSVEMRTRSQTLDRDIRDQLRRLGPGGRIDDVKRSFFYLTGLMDMGVAVPTWIAAYEVGMDQFAGDEAKAIDYADQLVRTTQSSGLQKDLAGIQRGDPKMKMFTAFYSYFSATYNLMVEESRRVKRPANMPRFVANMVLLTMLPAVASELLMGKGPEGDDDDDEKWAKWVAATTLKYALSGFVGVRDIVNGLGSNFGYAGSPVGSAAEAMVKLGKQLGEGEGDRALLKAAVDVAGPVLHLPSRQLWITAEGIYLWSEGAEITPFEMFVTRDSRKFR